MKKAADRSPDSNALMIFPEATTTPNRCLFQYKVGAFIPGHPIQPVCFKFSYHHFNPCWTGQAVGGNDLLMLLWRTCCQFANRLEIKILPVYYPNEAEK